MPYMLPKLLQSCLTLCEPLDCSPPGSSVHGILQRVGCHVLLQGIFPTQRSNPCLLCLLHWQAGSLPLAPLGNVLQIFLNLVSLFLLPLWPWMPFSYLADEQIIHHLSLTYFFPLRHLYLSLSVAEAGDSHKTPVSGDADSVYM